VVFNFICVCDAALKQAADISILASWYREQDNHDTPVVVIIDDMERCCGSVLSDFILMLRYSTAPWYPFHKGLYINLYFRVDVYVHICRSVDLCTCIRVSVCVFIFVYIHTYGDTHTQHAYPHIDTHTRARMHVANLQCHEQTLFLMIFSPFIIIVKNSFLS
jgi:hypothetical protein